MKLKKSKMDSYVAKVGKFSKEFNMVKAPTFVLIKLTLRHEINISVHDVSYNYFMSGALSISIREIVSSVKAFTIIILV